MKWTEQYRTLKDIPANVRAVTNMMIVTLVAALLAIVMSFTAMVVRHAN